MYESSSSVVRVSTKSLTAGCWEDDTSPPTPTLESTATSQSSLLLSIPTITMMQIDDIKDTVNSMRRNEQTTYYKQRVASTGVSGSGNGFKQEGSNIHLDVPNGDFFRVTIIQWMYNMASTFQFSTQVVLVANYYLDEMMRLSNKNASDGSDTPLIQTSVDYQLVALTSIYVAMKVYGSRLFPITEIIKLGRGQFTSNDIEHMERLIIHTCLKWKLTPPTYLCYMNEFKKLFDVVILQEQHEKNSSTSSSSKKVAIFDTANQLIQDVIYDETYVNYPPSIISSGAMLLAMERVGRQTLTSKQYELVLTQLKDVVSLTKSGDVKLLESALRLLDPSTNGQPLIDKNATRTCKDETATTSVEQPSSSSSTLVESKSNVIDDDGKQLEGNEKDEEQQQQEEEVVFVVVKDDGEDDDNNELLPLKRGFDSTATLATAPDYDDEHDGDEEDEELGNCCRFVSPTSVNG